MTRALVAFFALALAPVRALACDSPVPVEHVVDPTAVGVDATPPEKPIVTAHVTRSYGPRGGCGVESASSCDGFGFIRFAIEPGSDDRTPAEELGYSVRLVGGHPPANLEPAEKPVLAMGGNVWVHFPDPGPDEQKAFDAVFELVALDAAGNESEPSKRVGVAHQGDTSGCALGGRAPGSATPTALTAAFMLAWWARRRPRRRGERRVTSSARAR